MKLGIPESEVLARKIAEVEILKNNLTAMKLINSIEHQLRGLSSCVAPGD